MKFGSRMDVFVPPEVALVADEGDRTVAGETVIARWPSPDRVGPAGARPASSP
jgi:phosphatidylserine decarboxylase